LEQSTFWSEEHLAKISQSQDSEPGYTKISAKTADGPRYRALGNSMAVPVMAWIGRRIQMVEEIA